MHYLKINTQEKTTLFLIYMSSYLRIMYTFLTGAVGKQANRLSMWTRETRWYLNCEYVLLEI